jgi:acyl-CoA synthetase (AMP-forming)/AMP-acid ligase II
MQIMLKGRNVMMGYLADEAKTAQVIDENGWLHTGDIGQLDKVVYANYSIGLQVIEFFYMHHYCIGYRTDT